MEQVQALCVNICDNISTLFRALSPITTNMYNSEARA